MLNFKYLNTFKNVILFYNIYLIYLLLKKLIINRKIYLK